MRVESVYFFEGECEEGFIKAFKASKTISAGKTRKVNLWETANINRVIRLLPSTKKVDIFVIFDTDVTSEMVRFTNNIIKLAKNSRKVILLPQHKNFEDEIAFSCGNLSTSSLPNHLYKLSSIQELKTRLAQDKNLVEKLCSSGFDIQSMWSRLLFQNNVILTQKNIYWGGTYIIRTNLGPA